MIVKGRQQEYESDPSRFFHDEFKAQEDSFLQWMNYSWKKYELLGLVDQNEILDEIGKRSGF